MSMHSSAGLETRTLTGLLPSLIVKRTARIVRSAIAGRAIGKSGIGHFPPEMFAIPATKQRTHHHHDAVTLRKNDVALLLSPVRSEASRRCRRADPQCVCGTSSGSGP